MQPIEQPQFGLPEFGFEHKDRPCAFGVAVRWGRMAVVHVGFHGEDRHYDLPGGAIDGDETEAEALIREFGEETGLVVSPGAIIARADQLTVKKKSSRPVNNRSAFFETEVVGRAPGLKIEEDHTLVWLRPEYALRRLRHPSHAYAVAVWLRANS
jgi:8-oxo-dGTP diphosphatase